MTSSDPGAEQDLREVREDLRRALARSADQVAALRRQHDQIVAASESSNADDEHDPEGSTIAFERAQVATLLAQARRTSADLAEALTRVESGQYGRCESCGGDIGAARLEARPGTRTCIACASAGRSGR